MALMRTKTLCYSTKEMIGLITGAEPFNIDGIMLLENSLGDKGIRLHHDGTGRKFPDGLDIVRLDEDCEHYLRIHSQLLPDGIYSDDPYLEQTYLIRNKVSREITVVTFVSSQDWLQDHGHEIMDMVEKTVTPDGMYEWVENL